jgi:hypothetical protein
MYTSITITVCTTVTAIVVITLLPVLHSRSALPSQQRRLLLLLLLLLVVVVVLLPRCPRGHSAMTRTRGRRY